VHSGSTDREQPAVGDTEYRDVPSVQVAAREDVIEDRRYGDLFVRPKLQAKADESVAGSIERKRREAATHQVLRLVIQLLLRRVGTGHQHDERWVLGAGGLPQLERWVHQRRRQRPRALRGLARPRNAVGSLTDTNVAQ
jgi:hypothetical protein